MTFTYIGNLATDLDEVRFKIQDTVWQSGIKPNGVNFTDEEINGLLTIEGSVGRTIAAIYETLATVWSNHVDTKIGPRDEKGSQRADRYQKLAQKWREDYGRGASLVSVTTGFVTRVDGYSDDIDASETESLP